MAKLDAIRSELREVREFYGKYFVRRPIVGAIKCYKDDMREFNDRTFAVCGAVVSQMPIGYVGLLGYLIYLHVK
jgi:hypothetical protein